MAKEKMVTRRVIESKTYTIYKVEGTGLTEVGEITTKGRLAEKELAEQYGVDKVVCVLKSEERAVYGVPVDKFMEIAVKLEKDEE